MNDEETRDLLSRSLTRKRSERAPGTLPARPARNRYRGSRNKGARGQREARDVWVRHGFERCMVTPRSGGMRERADSNASPFPGDLMRIDPFLVEVKFDEGVERPSHFGLRGTAFIRKALRQLDATDRNNRTVGGRHVSIAVLQARANRHDWRFFVRAFDLLMLLGSHEIRAWRASTDEFVELDETTFFDVMTKGVGRG